FKRTKAKFVFTGVLIITLVYFTARQFNLVLTTAILQSFFTVIFIALIVIFQEEIRHFFEQLAFWSLKSNSRKKESSEFVQTDIEILSATLKNLAQNKIGALIVLPGKSPLFRHLEGGTDLNGKLSEPLLKSLFDPNSIGHDGAVVIEDGKVVKFSCHLPLSKNFEQLQHLGTRHSAALGLSEVSDALCIVVSEEQGNISITRNGEIKKIGFEQINLVLENFFNEMQPLRKQKKWHEFISKNFKEKSVAVVLAAGLWFVIVHESKLEYREFEIPVKYTELPPEYKIDSIDPKAIKVTLLGTRKKFYFFNANDIEVFLKIPEAEEGSKTLKLSENNINFPESFSLEDIKPTVVKIRIDRIETQVEQEEGNLSGKK
ncbi:MAG: diadenylate cyclase, partial [Thermodesulfobacteriota bacterium]